MSWILPKGIVVNSPGIEGSIERINTEPLDLADIANFWKVYTTTKRRLLDPTAERLENYWWRIWGSRKRDLNGATVASLFATISNGESFVPLRGPPNRDEGTTPWTRDRPGGSGASSTTALNRQSHGRPSTTTSSSGSKGAPPPPHPILKKSRGPSSTGPRPTARFIAPHEAEDGSGGQDSENAHVVVQPPSPDQPNSRPEKKPSGNGVRKARNIASAPSTKRPVVFRRKSSHSSDSPAMSVETGSSGLESSLETPQPEFLEADGAANKQSSQTTFSEDFWPANRLPSPSRNPSGTKSADSKRPSLGRSGSASGKGAENSSVVDSGVALTTDGRGISESDLTAEHEAIQTRRTLPPETTASDYLSIGGPPKRTQSDLLQRSYRSTDSRDIGPMRYLSNDAKSTPSLAPTLTDARGQLAAGQGTTTSAPKPSSQTPDKGKRRASDETKPTRSSTRRPTPPSGKGDESILARSKSQLELVLEKDRARNEHNKGGRRN